MGEVEFAQRACFGGICLIEGEGTRPLRAVWLILCVLLLIPATGSPVAGGDGECRIAIEGDTEFLGNLDYEDSVYTFVGTVRLLGYVFSSGEERPLVFRLVKHRGLVYVSGKGTVMTPRGGKIAVGGSPK